MPKLPLSLYGRNTTILNDKLVTTLEMLPKQFDFSFDFYPTKWRGNLRTTVLHLTTGSNCCSQGSRIPAVSLWMGYLSISFAVNGDGNYWIESPKLTLNRWVSFKINQKLEGSNYVYRVYMDKILLKTIVNKTPRDYKNVKVFVGDDQYTAQPGYVKNIKITTTPVVYASKSVSLFIVIYRYLSLFIVIYKLDF